LKLLPARFSKVKNLSDEFLSMFPRCAFLHIRANGFLHFKEAAFSSLFLVFHTFFKLLNRF